MNDPAVAALVIEELADENAILRERVVSLEADIDSYRALVSVLLDVAQAWRADPHREQRREQHDLDDLHRQLVRALVTQSEGTAA